MKDISGLQPEHGDWCSLVPEHPLLQVEHQQIGAVKNRMHYPIRIIYKGLGIFFPGSGLQKPGAKIFSGTLSSSVSCQAS